MNIHEFKERPNIDEVWDTFDYVAVMCGAGDDSVMLIAEMFIRGMEPNEIIFCDTGSEFPHTYVFMWYLAMWCDRNNWSKVVWLDKHDKHGKRLTVIGECQSKDTLPAAAFGFKSCSMRFKTETADKHFNNNYDCWVAWDSHRMIKNKDTGKKEKIYCKGRPISSHKAKILRLVGINADESHRADTWKNEDKWTQGFPLLDWDIGNRESDAVHRVGLYYPGKSSCTVCPHLNHGEIAMLRDNYPVQFKEAMTIESKFITTKDNDQGVRGLSRSRNWTEMLSLYNANPDKYKKVKGESPCGCND